MRMCGLDFITHVITFSTLTHWGGPKHYVVFRYFFNPVYCKYLYILLNTLGADAADVAESAQFVTGTARKEIDRGTPCNKKSLHDGACVTTNN